MSLRSSESMGIAFRLASSKVSESPRSGTAQPTIARKAKRAIEKKSGESDRSRVHAKALGNLIAPIVKTLYFVPLMIFIKEVNLAFGHKKVFEEISETIAPRDRIALVGRTDPVKPLY